MDSVDVDATPPTESRLVDRERHDGSPWRNTTSTLTVHSPALGNFGWSPPPLSSSFHSADSTARSYTRSPGQESGRPSFSPDHSSRDPMSVTTTPCHVGASLESFPPSPRGNERLLPSYPVPLRLYGRRLAMEQWKIHANNHPHHPGNGDEASFSSRRIHRPTIPTTYVSDKCHSIETISTHASTLLTTTPRSPNLPLSPPRCPRWSSSLVPFGCPIWRWSRPRMVHQLTRITIIMLLTAAVTEASPTGSPPFFDPATADIPNCSIPPYQPRTGDNYAPPTSTVDYCPTPFVTDSMTNATTMVERESLVAQLAMHYAPVLLFHPLEHVTLSRVERTFANPRAGMIFGPGEASSTTVPFADTLDLPTLFATTRDVRLGLRKHEYRFGHTLNQEYIAGDGFYAAEATTDSPTPILSRAVIYYHWYEFWVASSTDTDVNSTEIAMDGTANTTNTISSRTPVWVFNYYFYYPMAGVPSLGVAASHGSSSTTPSDDPEVSYSSFRSTPLGMHEGDWQSMSVMVCVPSSEQVTTVLDHSNSTTNTTLTGSNTATTENQTIELTAPIAVAYRQMLSSDGQSTRHITDCTHGDCVLYRNSTHPVGFVALGTHLTFSVPAVNLITREYHIEFLMDLQGVFSVEKTNFRDVNGQVRMFFPNTTNVVRHFAPAEIHFNTTDDKDLWQGYGGRWGCTCLVTEPDLIYDVNNPGLPQCFGKNGETFEECPSSVSVDEPVFDLLNQMLGVRNHSSSVFIQNTYKLRDQILELVTNDSPFGPPADRSFYTWMSPVNSPVQRTMMGYLSPEQYCARISEVTDPAHMSFESENMSLRANIIGIIAFATIIVVLNIIINTAYPLGFWNGQDFILIDKQTGVAAPPSLSTFFLVFGPALTYVAFYICTIIGVGLYFVGYKSLIEKLERTFSLNLDDAEALSYLFGICVLVMDSILVLLIWIPSRTIWLKTIAAYHELVGNEDQQEKFQRRSNFCARPSLVLFQIAYGVLFNSLILSVLTVLIGCLNVGIAYAIADICNNTVGSLTEMCLEVEAWGIAISCGEDFQSFCNQWASRDSVITLWGSFIIVTGHYFLISAAGAASKSFQSTPVLLQLLPKRSLYLKNIDVLRGSQFATENGERSSKVDKPKGNSYTSAIGSLDDSNGFDMLVASDAQQISLGKSEPISSSSGELEPLDKTIAIEEQTDSPVISSSSVNNGLEDVKATHGDGNVIDHR